MTQARFLDINPVLPVTNMPASIRFYTEKLGFGLVFQDPPDLYPQDPGPQHPSYAVLGRDRIQLHLQSHDPEAAGDQAEPLHIRFIIDDIDSLYTEYQASGAIVPAGFDGMVITDTPWGTREFGLYDPDKNGLFFYRNI